MTMNDYFQGLNEQQAQAVRHMEGPCMVLAGAGSGKTSVLTRRIAYLIDNGVRENSILAITFTNKAAEEMRNRVAGLIPGFSGKWIQTFHAACYRILQMDIDHLGYQKNFTIIDDTDAKGAIKQILKQQSDYDIKPEEILYYIKRAKFSMQDLNTFYQQQDLSSYRKDKFLAYHKMYQERLKSYNALDFEDMIVLTLKLLRTCPDVLEKYQEWFTYIMIDEYQDTNYAQYLLAKLLADKYRNIFAVGDPDQAIYSWRGAEPYNVRRFLNDYPEAEYIKLEVNYRSVGNILKAANSVINYNEDREEKNLVSVQGDGELLHLYCALDSFQEANYIVQNIESMVKQENRKFQDFAVFYRGHAQSRQIEKALQFANIPYQIVGARRFFERKEIKDIVAYLRIISNPGDLFSLSRVVNVPKRGVGEKTMERIRLASLEQGISPVEIMAQPEKLGRISKKVQDAMEEFCSMITFLHSMSQAGETVTGLIDQVLEMSGYIPFLYETKEPQMDIESRIENIQELRSVALEFDNQEGDGLESFLAQISLVQDSDEQESTDMVTLMTFHGAKGLEFPVVFMTGMEEGVFPSYRAEEEEQMAEERRICYVGITRAREKLFLTHTLNRLLYGSEHAYPPSRFLKEIPKELFAAPAERADLGSRATQMARKLTPADFAVGDQVEHRKFGRGIVLEIVEEGHLKVDFGPRGVRILIAGMAPLEKIEM